MLSMAIYRNKLREKNTYSLFFANSQQRQIHNDHSAVHDYERNVFQS
jgi:hypothetical protein